MPDNNNDPTTTPSNGAASPIEEAPRRTLREVAEAAYDEVVEQSEEQSEAEPVSDEQGRARDNLGRFVARPGEAAPDDGTQPRDDEAKIQQADKKPHPAPERLVSGESSEAPHNWKPEHRLMFSKLPAEGQSFMLERLSEMEGGLQRKIQANAQAAELVSSVAPYFQHPVMAESLRQTGLAPSDAIREWVGMHIRASSPDPQERMQFWLEMGQRMGLDPAALAPSRQGPAPQLSQADMQDPAIRYFADHLGRTVQDMQALRGQLSSMQQQDAERQNAEALKVTRWGIDSFAEEKDANGNLLRPDFDEALPAIIEMYRVNPELDLNQAYPEARWRTKSIRDRLIAAQQNTAQQKAADQRARQAVRSNVRGLTSPVSKPADPGGSRSLRDVLESSADEVGF